MIKNVIFDMDGVIFDTERFYLECCIPAAQKVGLEGIEEIVSQCIGMTTIETNRLLTRRYGEDAPLKEFHQETSRIFHERYEKEGLPVKEGVRGILAWLKGASVRTALASSTEIDTVTRELRDAGLLPYFDQVIGGDMARRSKPAPDIFLLAAERLEADPADCFVIEDSYYGIRAASAAGMKPIMVPDLLAADEEMQRLAIAVLPNLEAVQKYLDQFV